MYDQNAIYDDILPSPLPRVKTVLVSPSSCRGRDPVRRVYRPLAAWSPPPRRSSRRPGSSPRRCRPRPRRPPRRLRRPIMQTHPPPPSPPSSNSRGRAQPPIPSTTTGSYMVLLLYILYVIRRFDYFNAFVYIDSYYVIYLLYNAVSSV